MRFMVADCLWPWAGCRAANSRDLLGQASTPVTFLIQQNLQVNHHTIRGSPINPPVHQHGPEPNLVYLSCRTADRLNDFLTQPPNRWPSTDRDDFIVRLPIHSQTGQCTRGA